MPAKKDTPTKDVLDEFARKAEEIEAEKERKRQDRLRRKQKRLAKERAERREKLLGPILFLVISLISWVIFVFFKQG